MKYLSSVSFPNNYQLVKYLNKHTYQDWPFNVFLDRGLDNILFEEITIMYGNNGSGKSTILNMIGEKIGATRKKPLFKDHKLLDGCQYCPVDNYLENVSITMSIDPDTGFDVKLPQNIKLITSDDIFKKINDTVKNNIISNDEGDVAYDDYYGTMGTEMRFNSLDDYDNLVKWTDINVRKKSAISFVRDNSRNKLTIHSNGETALDYFESTLEPDGIYLLDEPENCLSPGFQIELIKIIVKAKRYFNCQFIIATHSPLILSIPEAVVYDLDNIPVQARPWNELENVKVYFDFFYTNKEKFGKG